MIIQAVRDALDGLGIGVYDNDATEADNSWYVLLVGGMPGRGREEDVCGRSFQADLIVRAVGVDAGHARDILAATRQRLRGLHAVSQSHALAFHWDGTPRAPVVERVVRNETTDTNSVFIDDEYTVLGEPYEGR